MRDLIKALTIFLKYGNPVDPTHCEHDILRINPDITQDMVSDEDKQELQKLGFISNSEGFYSYKFGSS